MDGARRKQSRSTLHDALVCHTPTVVPSLCRRCVPTTCDDPFTLEVPYGQSPNVVEHDLQTHTWGEIKREPNRIDLEGTREEPLDGAACNLGACMRFGYRGSSMAAVEITKRERERERDGGIKERGGRGGK
jgi:hypothetical protein